MNRFLTIETVAQIRTEKSKYEADRRISIVSILINSFPLKYKFQSATGPSHYWHNLCVKVKI